MANDNTRGSRRIIPANEVSLEKFAKMDSDSDELYDPEYSELTKLQNSLVQLQKSADCLFENVKRSEIVAYGLHASMDNCIGEAKSGGAMSDMFASIDEIEEAITRANRFFNRFF